MEVAADGTVEIAIAGGLVDGVVVGGDGGGGDGGGGDGGGGTEGGPSVGSFILSLFNMFSSIYDRCII